MQTTNFSFHFKLSKSHQTVTIGCGGILLTSLEVPSAVEVGSKVVLRCDFDLEGNSLYSVKWYKDDVEFYRFIPKLIEQRIKIFNTSELNIGSNTTERRIYLENVNINTSGTYKCEISGEAPDFTTQQQVKKLFVYILPKSKPSITGKRYLISLGQTIHMNCTSPGSRPASNLTWYINDILVTDDRLIKYPEESNKNSISLTTQRIVGLKFKVEDEQVKRGRIAIKCMSAIDMLQDVVPDDKIMKSDEIRLLKHASDRSLAWATADFDGNNGCFKMPNVLTVFLAITIVQLHKLLLKAF